MNSERKELTEASLQALEELFKDQSIIPGLMLVDYIHALWQERAEADAARKNVSLSLEDKSQSELIDIVQEQAELIMTLAKENQEFIGQQVYYDSLVTFLRRWFPRLPWPEPPQAQITLRIYPGEGEQNGLQPLPR